MTLIDGDKIVTAQLYDDQYEEFTEKKMSIIDYVNAYTDEGVTTADDVIDKIRAEIQATIDEEKTGNGNINKGVVIGLQMALDTIDKYKAESEE